LIRLAATLLLGLLAADAHAAAREADVAKAADAIVAGTNAFRREHELPALRVNPKLEATAREFARYMASTNRYGHEADGRHPEDRAQAHGYGYCIVLENIAYQFDSRGFETMRLALDVLEGWKGSPGHRKNMLDASVRDIGVAIARSAANGYYYSVQVFGLPREASVRFEVRNESRRTVRYRVGDDAFDVPPRYSRTHEMCAPGAVRFEQVAGPAAAPPKSGDRFVIAPAGDRVSVQRR
jgi:uncharacterized protein YkwD